MSRIDSSSMPAHKISDVSHFGIFIKSFSADTPLIPINYSHRDNYYVFGYVEAGKCNMNIDFDAYTYTAGEAFVIRPNSVHSFVDSTPDAAAKILLVDSQYIDEPHKIIMSDYAFSSEGIIPDTVQQAELATLLSMIASRFVSGIDESPSRVILYLALAAVEIIVGSVHLSTSLSPVSRRYRKITNSFFSLMNSQLTELKLPAQYAKLMNITPGYLNEAVRNTTSQSVGNHIRNEIILRAKRRLVYSSDTIKQIALELGYEDYAYFTRLFTKVAGITPSDFRRNYLK